MNENTENHANFAEKSPENSIIGYAPITYRESSETLNSGEQWFKIPAALFKLHELIKATPAQQVVALAMAGYCMDRKNYPTFSVGLAKIAKKTGLTERGISDAIRFLSDNRVLFVRSRNGVPNQYTWNENFIFTHELASVAPLNEVQGNHRTSFSGTTEAGSYIYIELSLEFFRTSLEAFFDVHHKDYEPYQFYVPGKRCKKGVATTATGYMRTVERWEAWEEATKKIWNEIKHQNMALTRLFFALMARNVEGVGFPYAALRYRVSDQFTQHEAMKRSHLNLYCDEDVMEFLDKRFKRKGGNL